MKKLNELEIGQELKVENQHGQILSAIVTKITNPVNDIANRTLVKIEPTTKTSSWYGYAYITDQDIKYNDEIHISKVL